MNKTLTGITVAPLTRLFTLGLCIFAIGHVWATAPTATAVWRSNLGDSYRIGGLTYAIMPSVGTLNPDGTITAPSEWSSSGAPYIDLSTIKPSSVTVLVKFSGLSLPVSSGYGYCIADIKDSDGNQVGSYIAKNATRLSAFYIGSGGNTPTQVALTGSDNAVTTSGYILFSYSASSGVKVYMGSTISGLVGGSEGSYHYSNKTISQLRIGGDDGTYYDPSGIKIEEVALFVGSYLSNTDVADYTFPTVTALNSEDVLTITQLNTATAANNAIHCIVDNPVVTWASDETPSAATKTFLQGANWCGTIWMNGVAVTDFAPGDYGNSRSNLKLSGVYGYFAASHTCSVPVELSNTGASSNYSYGLNVNNGSSRDANNPNRIIQFSKLKGTGALWTSSSAPTVTMQVLDWSEYTGSLQFVNKIIILGDTVPAVAEHNTAGTIYICEGKTAAINSSASWRADGHFVVNGTLKINSYDRFSTNNSSDILINETGVLEITSNAHINQTSKNMSRIKGTGTVYFHTDGDNWIGLPQQGNGGTMFAETLAVSNMCPSGVSVSGGLVFSETMSIGTLSGSGNLRSDLGSSTANSKTLTIVQAKDSEWSGLLHNNNSRTKQISVRAKLGASNKTLKLSGTQTTSNPKPLVVEAANASYDAGSVNLTGTWNAAVEANGIFGGTGTVSGNLTFGNGSVLKVFSTDDDGLTVSSNVTFPTGDDAMTVDLSGITISAGGIKILSSASLTSQSQIANVTSSDAILRIEEGALVAYPKVLFVPTVGDAVAYSSVSDTITPIAIAGGSYQYVEVLTSEEQNISLSLLSEIKIKNTGGATLSFSGYGDDCQYYADTTTSDVYVIHKKVSKPTVYTWTGLAPQIYNYDTYEYEDDTRWSSKGNWTFVNSSSETVTATRAPSSGDYVYFTSNATVELGDSVTVASLISSAAVAISKDVSDVTLSATGGIILSAAGASITVDGVTLSPAPSTTVDGYYVKRTGTTTYTYTAVQKVASAVINDETVYFDDIDDAFAEITADHSVTVTIINGEGDYDDYDDTIAKLGFFREGANVKFLAAERRNINGSLIAQYSSAQEAIDADDGLTIICICAEATVSARVTRPMFIKPVGILLDDITINCYLAGYSYVKPDSDLSPTYPGVYQINAQASAATFTWNSSVASGNWNTIGNWVSEDGEVGFVPNNSAWDVVLNTDATITMGNSRTVGHLSVGAAVDIRSSDDKELTLTDTDGVELTSASASITLTRQGGSGLTKVNLTSTPYTSLEGMYVKTSDPTGSATVYEVATKVASVTDSGSNVTYYDSLATAVSSASTGDSIALFANSSEAITLNDKTINFSEGSYTFTGSFTGNGTLVLGAALKSASSDRWPVGWTGTVELKGITSVIADFNFAHYGNANSTVKANNVLIRLNPEATGTDVGGVGAIEVASGGLKFGGTKIVDNIFYISATITGSGTISVGTPGGETDDAAHKATCTKYVFSGDYSAFRGAVNFSGASSYRAGIVFRNGSDTIPTQTDWGQIIVTENATLTTSGTLDGAGGFVIEGEIDLLSGGSVTTGGAKIGGDGLIVLTEGSSGALASSKFNSTTWTGTVELKDITTAIANFDFANYGTVNSTVRANNVKVKENYSAIGNVGCIDIAAGGLTFGDSSAWNNDNTVTIAADITGSGSIVVATCDNPDVGYNSYVFTGDLTGFSGSLKAQAYNATYNSIIVIKGDGDAIPTATGVGQMFITENATVNVGASATWTATTLTIDGTMSVASGGTLSGTIAGSGTVSFAATPGESALTFGSWTGTVEIPAHTTNTRLNLNAYGKVGSTVKFGGMSDGWIQVANKDVNPDLYLTGYFCPADMSEQTYTFRKITGTGSIAFPSSSPTGISISEFAKIDGYAGSIVNNSTATLSIGTLSLPAGADVSCGAKLLSTGGTGTITLGSITVGGVALSNVSYSRNTSGAEGDGFYVNAAATTTGTGESAVTIITTDGSTTSVAVTLDNDYSGKIAIPANVATLTVTGPTITAGKLQLVTTQGTYDNLLSYSAGAVSLNPSAYYQNGEGEANKIYVEPKTAASNPMTMPGATTAPSFSIKTIPGLYYAVQTGAFNGSGVWVPDGYGDAVQATSASTSVTAPEFSGTVQYYKIGVGLTADDAK